MTGRILPCQPVTRLLATSVKATRPPSEKVSFICVSFIIDLTLFPITGVLSFHASAHGHSQNCQSCLSEIVKSVFDSKYACAATKSGAIVKGVFGTAARKKLSNDLRRAKFICISTDGSTIQKEKLLPIFASYFDSEGGLQHRLLNIVSMPDEKGRTIAWAIKWTYRYIYGIPDSKIIAICADNCPTNYGSMKRTGQENVFAILRNEVFGKKLFGIGCFAHILNNALKQAANKISLKGAKKITEFLGFIHRYFESETGNRSCEFVRIKRNFMPAVAPFGEEVKAKSQNGKGPTKSFSMTRWLSTGPALKALDNNFEGLKAFFNGLDMGKKPGKHAKDFKAFFNDPFSSPWLIFLQFISEEFEDAIRKMEGSGVTFTTALSIVNKLKLKMSEYETNETMPEELLFYLDGQDEAFQRKFRDNMRTVYQEVQVYIGNWTEWAGPFDGFRWSTLEALLNEEEVLKSTKFFEENQIPVEIDMGNLRDEIVRANEYIESKLPIWTGTDSPTTSAKWIDLLKSVENLHSLRNIAEYILTLPGTNATCERLFSEVGFIWNKWSNSQELSTVLNTMMVRFNLVRDCQDALTMLITDPALRAAIRSNDKYERAKMFDANSPSDIMRLYDSSKCDDMGWNAYQEFLQETFGANDDLDVAGLIEDDDWSLGSLSSSSDTDSDGSCAMADSIDGSELDELAFDQRINDKDCTVQEEIVGDTEVDDSYLDFLQIQPKRARMSYDEEPSGERGTLTVLSSFLSDTEHEYGQLPLELVDPPEFPRASSLLGCIDRRFSGRIDEPLRRSLPKPLDDLAS